MRDWPAAKRMWYAQSLAELRRYQRAQSEHEHATAGVAPDAAYDDVDPGMPDTSGLPSGTSGKARAAMRRAERQVRQQNPFAEAGQEPTQRASVRDVHPAVARHENIVHVVGDEDEDEDA